MEEKNRRLDEAALRRLLEREQTGPEALVLRLAWLEGLTREEIAALTWEQVSFLDDRLELPDRMIPLDREVRSLLWKLREAREAREEPGDPHVLLSARERKPLRLGDNIHFLTVPFAYCRRMILQQFSRRAGRCMVPAKALEKCRCLARFLTSLASVATFRGAEACLHRSHTPYRPAA